MKKLFLLISVILLYTSSFGQNHPEVKIFTGHDGLEKIARMGIPPEEGYNAKEGYIRTVISEEMLPVLTRNGFNYEIIQKDYPSFIAERSKEAEDFIRRINHEIKNKSLKTSNYPVPAGFELGSMAGYYNYTEVLNEMDSLHNMYPALVTARTQCNSTQSWEGRTIQYLMITNSASTQPKVKILYDALTHAREPMGMQQLFFYMWYLVENYNTNPEVHYLLDNVEMYFIPVMNPDGYEYNCSTMPNGGGDWRKNRRDNGGGNIGVDLNRNFGFKWGFDDVGSSPYAWDLTYRGPSAFSEPETQSVRDFCAANNFLMALNYHTYGGLMLYPWCYITDYTPDSISDIKYSTEMTRYNRFNPGPPGAILYNTNGDINDWMYGDQTTKPKIMTYTSEIGTDADGFWPAPWRIIPICQQTVYQNLMIAHFALKYAQARDASPVIIPERTGYLAFDFERYGMSDTGTYTVSVEPLDPAQIISVGAPKVFNNPGKFDVIHDSVSFSLDSQFPVGGSFSYIIKCSNGLYTYADTITKWFGTPMVVFEDNCSTFGNWTGTPWNITTSSFVSQGASITDSPSGNYANNLNSSVTTTGKIDLKDSPVAEISFSTKYALENIYDYVQIKTSDSNGTVFTPRAGRLTGFGSMFEDEGNPVYDGIRKSWEKEFIAVDDLVNNKMKIRFTLKSDQGTRLDGFYFDDLKVRIIDMSTVGVAEKNDGVITGLQPNPADEKTEFSWNFPSVGSYSLRIINAEGKTVFERNITEKSGKIVLDLTAYSSGIYQCVINGSSIKNEVKKLIIIH